LFLPTEDGGFEISLYHDDLLSFYSIPAGLRRFLSGIFYMVLFVVLNPSFNAGHFLTEWFEVSLFGDVFLVVITGNVTF
jgi:hypothetical protein